MFVVLALSTSALARPSLSCAVFLSELCPLTHSCRLEESWQEDGHCVADSVIDVEEEQGKCLLVQMYGVLVRRGEVERATPNTDAPLPV